MLQSAKKMKTLALGARDGRIGHVEEFYFDDTHWTLRYVVVQAGNWLTGRLVLLSPHVLGKPDETHKIIPVDLSRDEIQRSPSPESDRPVSRQFEEDYYRYFGWPYYWAGPYLWGPSPFPVLPTSPLEEEPDAAKTSDGPVPKMDPHLRSSNEMMGYHIRARDGEIGHVEDFLYDDQDWSIHYLVADTRNWWPGKKVLIPPTWIGKIHWEERNVEVEVSREVVRQAPAYDPHRPVTHEFEKELARYYEAVLEKA